jgi:two-component system, OmpR family, alkaline phosphatase synthesis response regulator PhoP
VDTVLEKPKILVVEDEPDALELVAFNLRTAGYQVVTAETGWRGVLAARESHPALILLDVMLPELDGFAVCEILRKDPNTKEIPIIFLTAWSSENARHIGYESGADDYVTKPFSPRELVQRVNRRLMSPMTAVHRG